MDTHLDRQNKNPSIDKKLLRRESGMGLLLPRQEATHPITNIGH
jgi:hypothetical protein